MFLIGCGILGEEIRRRCARNGWPVGLALRFRDVGLEHLELVLRRAFVRRPSEAT